MSPADDWRPVCRLDALVAQGRIEVAWGRRAVLLLWQDGGVIACAAHCPHAMAPLADGAVKDGRLHCPRHQASFDLITGAPDDTWRIDRLKIYRARVNGDVVEVLAD